MYKNSISGKCKLKTKTSCEVTGEAHIILAESEPAAIKRYKQFYQFDPQYAIVRSMLPDGWSILDSITINNFVNTLMVTEPKNMYPNMTIDTLKEQMYPEDFLEYCRQILYPVEKILN